MKKYTLSFAATLLLVPFLALAQTVLPSAGLTPESPFYFLDRFTEALQEFFTFNPEAKARLEISFAAERIAEIKVILENKGVGARGIEVAENRLKAHLEDAANIVADQKAKGKDVSKLAKELDDEFDGPKNALEQTFKDEKLSLEAKEKDLKSKIKTAREAKDVALEDALSKELEDLKSQKELLGVKKEDQEKALENEGEKIKDEMDAKTGAEKAIKEAEEGKQEILDESAKENISVPVGTFEKFDKLLKQAKELFDRENYVEARQLAKQAEKSLDGAEKAIEDIKESKDNEEEIEADREEQNRDVKQKRVEKTKENIKEESELNKEQRGVKEENQENENQIPNNDKKRGESASLPQSLTVIYEDDRFSPSEIKVKKGDTVTWTNRDSSAMWPASAFHPTHTAYDGTSLSEHCNGNSTGFDSCKGIESGASWSFKFDKVGSWHYHDHLNPSSTGTVVVE